MMDSNDFSLSVTSLFIQLCLSADYVILSLLDDGKVVFQSTFCNVFKSLFPFIPLISYFNYFLWLLKTTSKTLNNDSED